jgi:hypothetical protein
MLIPHLQVIVVAFTSNGGSVSSAITSANLPTLDPATTEIETTVSYLQVIIAALP